MVTSVVTTKGQIVIPSAVRRRHGIKKGTRLCVTEMDGVIVLQPLTREYFEKTAGILSGKKKLSRALLEERARQTKEEEAICVGS